MQRTHILRTLSRMHAESADDGGNGHLKAKVGESMKLLVTLLGFVRLVGSGQSVSHLVIVG